MFAPGITPCMRRNQEIKEMIKGIALKGKYLPFGVLLIVVAVCSFGMQLETQKPHSCSIFTARGPAGGSDGKAMQKNTKLGELS